MNLHSIRRNLDSDATVLTYDILDELLADLDDDNPQGTLVRLWDDGEIVFGEWRYDDHVYAIHAFEYDEALTETGEQHWRRDDYRRATAACARGEGYYWNVWVDHIIPEDKL